MTREWRSTDAFCPYCGDNMVYYDESYDDYYVGTLYRCEACLNEWTMQV